MPAVLPYYQSSYSNSSSEDLSGGGDLSTESITVEHSEDLSGGGDSSTNTVAAEQVEAELEFKVPKMFSKDREEGDFTSNGRDEVQNVVDGPVSVPVAADAVEAQVKKEDAAVVGRSALNIKILDDL